MRTAIFAATLLVAAAAWPSFAAAAPAQIAALAPVHRFIDSLDKGDMKAAAAAYARSASIIDEFPPYHWQGEKAFAWWSADFAKFAKGVGVTEPKVTLEAPRRVMLTGDRAYAVIPAHFSFEQHGAQHSELGTFAFALVKTGGGWRIAAWSWAWVHDSR